MPEVNPEVILCMDTGVLSNFALSRSIFILKSCYSRHVYITSFVMAEILKGLRKGYQELSDIKIALSEGWLIETPLTNTKEKDLFETLSASLGAGESSSIAVAKNRGLTFASDDLTARREAALLNVPLTGTIGILVRAVNSRIITPQRGEILLTNMKEHGFYAPVESLKQIVKH